MSLLKKLCNGLTLRCLGAVGFGLGIVTLITLGLLALSGGIEDTSGSRLASYNNLRFPEDEQMLKELSAQILKDTSLAAAAKDLQNIRPAAGAAPPSTDSKPDPSGD